MVPDLLSSHQVTVASARQNRTNPAPPAPLKKEAKSGPLEKPSMMLQLLKSHPAPDICLLGFSGKLLMGKESREVEGSVSELIGKGMKKIIFDLSKLDSIDSTGIGIIVMCGGKAKKAGGEVRIAGPEGVVKDTLVMTRVDRLVRIFPTVDEATQKF
jgi:anti-sigma B factor antagonist